jgi:ferredoxin
MATPKNVLCFCAYVVASWLQSSHPCSLQTALTNCRHKIVLLCPWPPSQGLGPPACRPTVAALHLSTSKLSPLTGSQLECLKAQIRSCYTPLGWTAQKTLLPTVPPLLSVGLLHSNGCLQSRSLATAVSAGFTILAFSRHATIPTIHVSSCLCSHFAMTCKVVVLDLSLHCNTFTHKQSVMLQNIGNSFNFSLLSLWYEMCIARYDWC